MRCNWSSMARIFCQPMIRPTLPCSLATRISATVLTRCQAEPGAWARCRHSDALSHAAMKSLSIWAKVRLMAETLPARRSAVWPSLMNTRPSMIVASRCTCAGSAATLPALGLDAIGYPLCSPELWHDLGCQQFHGGHDVAMRGAKTHVEYELIDAEVRIGAELINELTRARDQQGRFHVGQAPATPMRGDGPVDHLSIAGTKIMMALVIAGCHGHFLIDFRPIPTGKAHTQHRQPQSPCRPRFRATFMKGIRLSLSLLKGSAQRCGCN